MVLFLFAGITFTLLQLVLYLTDVQKHNILVSTLATLRWKWDYGNTMVCNVFLVANCDV